MWVLSLGAADAADAADAANVADAADAADAAEVVVVGGVCLPMEKLIQFRFGTLLFWLLKR